MSENLILDRFAEPITALADTPALAAAELKRRFQAPAEELRQVHNALAEQHAALEDKVEGIVTETYGGTIHESMLDTPLAAKINGKAAQSDMETLQNTVSGHTAQLELKCGLTTGTYTGNGEATQDIKLGFRHKAVLVMYNGNQTWSTGDQIYGGLSIDGRNAAGIEITDTGFQVKYSGYVYLNRSSYSFSYLAFR